MINLIKKKNLRLIKEQKREPSPSLLVGIGLRTAHIIWGKLRRKNVKTERRIDVKTYRCKDGKTERRIDVKT